MQNLSVDEEPIQQRDIIGSLAKGLEVLRAFDEASPQLSTADLAKKLGISRASARRFLLTLSGLGYLRKQGQYFQPTSKVLSLSAVFSSSMPLSTVAQPYLEEVTRRTEETCSLGVLENNMMVFVARSHARWILIPGLRVGSSLPAYCSAIGRVLLATLHEDDLSHYLETAEIRPLSDKTITRKSELREIITEVRQRGYSIVDQELEQGLRSIAVPVDQGDKTVASVSIASQVNRATLKRMKQEFLPVLREAASAISREMSRS
jgi:IclR family transcriptional regulator, pca regulon regulatory protein